MEAKSIRPAPPGTETLGGNPASRRRRRAASRRRAKSTKTRPHRQRLPPRAPRKRRQSRSAQRAAGERSPFYLWRGSETPRTVTISASDCAATALQNTTS